MSRGYYVPCAPFLYLVPDSGGAPPGMDCMPLQRSPGPFHYLIHEQAKSLVALQELQNEVGALLEFRDIVMETFPLLRNRMVAGITSSNVSHTSSTPSSGTSNIPIPLTSSRRDWEPGIRVRRKIQSHTSAKDPETSVSSLASNRGRSSKTAVHTQQPKSGEGINSGSGTSSAGSSAVQDSGFGTETSSSKEHCHSSSSSTATGPVVVHRPAAASAQSPAVLDEAEDELWNLLDVIHRKGTKLREEVEYLQQRFQVSDRLGMLGKKAGEGVLRRRSLGDIEQQLVHESGKICPLEEREMRLRNLKTGKSRKALLDVDGHSLGKLDSGREARSEDELRSLQRERDLLLDKVAEMEAETLASRARASQLQTELGCLIEAKRDLEEQLRAAVSQKSELNSRIHDLHLQFVSGNKNSGGSSSSYSPLSDTTVRKLLLVPGTKRPVAVNHASQERLRNVVSSQAAYGRGSSPGRGQSCFTPVPVTSRRFSEGATSIKSPDEKNTAFPHLSGHSQQLATSLPRQELDDVKSEVLETRSANDRLDGFEDSDKPRLKLGTLDGIVSSPSNVARIARGVRPDPHKVAAILQEFSPIELQRHLLTTSVENKALHQRLEKTVKSHVNLVEQLEKIRDENDDLKFQLEEKSIELEGTKAQVRVLERLQQKASRDTATILPLEATTNPTLPLLALPMPVDDNLHHSSSTESAHDHTLGIQNEESTSDQGEAKKLSHFQQMSPRRRPSKIPLPGTKSYCAPKPPSGKSVLVSSRNRGSPSLKSRTDSNSSLSGKNPTRELSWKNRSDSCSSLTGGKSRESPSGGRNSSLLGRNNSRDSLNSGSKSRDSFTTSTGKARGGDSLSGKKSNCDSISSSVCKVRTDTPSHQSSFSSNVSGINRRESLSSGKGKDNSSFSSSIGRKGLHHQTPASTRMGRGGSNNSSINQRIGNGNLNEQGDQNSKVRPTKLSFWSNWLKILDNGPS